MALPNELSAECPLCGQEFAVRVWPAQAVVGTDRDTGDRTVSLSLILETPTHACPGVPAKPTAAKRTAKKATVKRTTRATA